MKKSREAKSENLSVFWKSQIDRWAESSMTQVEYCRQQKLVPHRFTYWKSKFKKQNLPVEFVQIPEPIPINSVGLKLNIGQGLQIEIPDDFSHVTLEQVLVTLKVLQ